MDKSGRYYKRHSLAIHRMKSCFAVVLLGLSVFISGCKDEDPGKVKHVILISLDGARPEFYMDSSEWDAPVLRELKNRGVYAGKGITSVFPSLTYPAHTAIITGAYPAHHGIYFNKPFGAEKWDWNWNAEKIKTATLWDAVKDKHLTSGSVYWPVTVGAPIDYNFPSRNPKAGEQGNILTVKYPFITPKSLLKDIEKKKGITFTADDLSFPGYRYGKTISVISSYIIKTYKPNLMALRFFAIDHFSHATGANSSATHEAVRVTDSLVGTILKAVEEAGIKENTAVIITGDHGHTDTKGVFSPNVYLSEHMRAGKDNWRARFYSAGGSGFLYVNGKKDPATVDSVVAILKATPEYKNGYFRILDRKALDEMGANPHTPIALSMKEGITVSDDVAGPPFEALQPPYKQSTHGYDPAYPAMKTAFIAAGAGIKKQGDIQHMGVQDIAPLISKLLGLGFNALDGKLIEGIVAEDK